MQKTERANAGRQERQRENAGPRKSTQSNLYAEIHLHSRQNPGTQNPEKKKNEKMVAGKCRQAQVKKRCRIYRKEWQ